MEGKPSRRKSRNPKITERNESDAGPQNTSAGRTTRYWPCSIVICPLVLCVLTALLFLQQFTTLDPLRSVLSSPKVHHGETLHSQVHNPDSARPSIELHPEDHVYRGPVTQHLDWVVTADYLRPDGVLKQVYLVNGIFPGPTIETRSGDTLIINVANALQEEPISIHWHGIHVHNTMDGVPGVTQNVIPPGSTFVYNLTVPNDQSGTFWYHGHTGTSRADGLYGGFVVHAPSSRPTVRGLMARDSAESLQYGYEREFLLLIGDWYHQPGDQVLAWYMSIASFGNEPVPDSLLINGAGSFDCSMAVPARPLDCVEQHTNLSYLSDIDTAYRLRVVNTGSLAGFTLSFENKPLTLIQVDSTSVEPQEAPSAGILYPGQRMDVVLQPSKEDLTSLTIHLDQDCFNYPNIALTPTQTFPITPSHIPLSPQPLPKNTLDLQNTPSQTSLLSIIPETPTQTQVIYTKIQKLSINHNIPNGFFNRTSWRPQPDTPLNTLPREKWDDNQFSFAVPDSEWIDVVVNNLDEGGHPFHLHGHHFYILRVYEAPIGWGSYNPFVDAVPPGLESESGYDLSRAMLRDTVYIPSRGYAVLRFRADNPGVWLFHCHIVWHLASGMAMVIDVGEDNRY
ncbi:multicopper oxidase-domain-containing protein [Aspergillus pseudonomiae]|uniref:Multicopper oxidase-domain-containing protein n=1 Tax=Aspergillus pseudonomiae TaxID=1506151 RepID=A0A5N7CTX5_9EURO|nr:multicopper oxidase-domain-containing protein [Aspergillus pseudonomiae]KAB8253740.1 multicopper oxidase-domain-containing protein [Aspergillus pseudonomiae]KAE8397098.1 multicopper oxidase-domain-containing protein [Aspergillus pseudonomiae]